MSVGDGTVWLVRSSSNEQLMGWFLERLLPDGTRDPSFPSQQIRFTSRYQYPPLLFASLPQGQIMALNPALIEGQPRHGAAKLHPLATNRVVVAAESARISEMAGLATVRLIRGGPATNGLVLDWITEPVSAVPGVDYTFSQGRVNFPAGSHEAEVQVPVLDNNLPDRDRFVQLRFNGGSDATPPPTGFSIANDDPGFPADGIVVLTEGGVLLRPTGWLGSETHYTRVEAGSLGSFQEWFQLSEPFPEMVALGLAVYPNPLFFRVRSIPLSSP
jgi:hypothetical protein